MSDNLQMQGSQPHRRSSAKTSRYATSCTECRRRKQKCNQGQPCSNCVRRFPQPTCEYSTRVTKRPTGSGSSGISNVKLVLEGNAYSHLDLADIQDAILQVEGIKNGHSPATAVARRRVSDSSDKQESSSSSSSASEPFRVVVTDETGLLRPKSVLALLRMILHFRLKVANSIVNDEWSIDGTQLLRAVQEAARPATMIGGLDHQLRNLPMAPTKLNFELVRIHLQLLSRFKASVDGNPDPDNRFMKYWVPLSIKNPLLLQIVLYTAACFLNELGRVPKMLVWAYKGGVHRMLNDHLNSTKTQTSDIAIMGTNQMVMDSWYWGTTAELRAHMDGLKTMIRMRGGLQGLGMQGFLAKVVIIHDISIALAHEIEPDIYGQEEFGFHDDFMIPYQVSFNSPLLSEWPPFLSPACSLRLHPSSAQILDDVRSVIKAVLSLPLSPTAEELQNVDDAAVWALGRLNQMPENVPLQDGKQSGQTGQTGQTRRYSEDSDEGSSPSNYSDGSTAQNGPPSSAGTPPSQTTSEDSGMSPRSVGLPPDLMYRCIRMTASIYYRAIIARVPTTEICGDAEFLQMWELIWAVSLPTWKTAVGIYLWVMVAIVPSCHQAPPARFIKTLMVVGFMTMGLENWHVTIDAAEAALRLQRWLRDGGPDSARAGDKGVVGGESVVEKHGFILKDLPEVANLRCDDLDELELIE